VRPSKNPLVPDTFDQRVREWWCGVVGHIRFGTYYRGMPQAHCRRCGMANKYMAAAWCPPWIKPYSAGDSHDH